MNVLDDIATWIASTSTGLSGTQIGGGVSTAYSVYKSREPASTGNMYVIYQYGGMAPEPIADGSIDNPRIQVRTISAVTSDSGYQAALTLSNRLRYVVNRPLPTTTAANTYLTILPLQSPEYLGSDVNDRAVWVQNFQISITYSA